MNYSVVKIGGKRYVVLDCKRCPSTASLLNKNCLACLSKLQYIPFDGIIFDKGNFRKVLNKEGVSFVKMINFLARSLPTNVCENDYSTIFLAKELLKEDPTKAIELLMNAKFCNEDSPKIKNVLKRLKSFEAFAYVRKGDTSVFQSTALPSFVSFSIQNPVEYEVIEEYNVDGNKVTIAKGKSKTYYLIDPAELKLEGEELDVINKVMEKLKEIGLGKEEIIENLLADLDVDPSKIKILAPIIRRYTYGYGIIETILKDPKVQDVFLNSPGSTPLFVYHEDYEECQTNLYLSDEEIERIATKLRLISGRPFDESHPVIHTDIPELGVRATGIQKPLTFDGIGFAFRKHSIKPWTLVKLASKGMFSPQVAGFLSFLADSQQSLLITGPRGSGKTSLLGAMLVEIPSKYRMIVIEDTPELPVRKLKELEYNIEHLKVRSFDESYELSPQQALHTALRLGESVLVIGEVRGNEAKSLFEAMRVGAAGNVVMGTIHGKEAYDVWDRIVNDLGVASTSFKATDFVISCIPRREGELRKRRIFKITEVLKHWQNDPLAENGFNEIGDGNKVNLQKSKLLAKYAELRNVEVDDLMEEITLRAKMKEMILDRAKEDESLLELEFNVEANKVFRELLKDKSTALEKFEAWLESKL